jgi:hypothetical protein
VVHGLAQATVFGVRHDRMVGREVQRQEPAITIAFGGFGGGAFECLRGQAGEILGIVEM